MFFLLSCSNQQRVMPNYNLSRIPNLASVTKIKRENLSKDFRHYSRAL